MFQMDLFEKSAVDSVRAKVRAEALEGADLRCPVCSRLVKLYKRRLHSEMVLWLAGLEFLCRDGEYHTTLEIIQHTQHLEGRGTNGALLIHWGLIVKIPVENRGNAPAGSYRITDKGKAFLAQRIEVPARAHFLCEELVGFSQETTTAAEAVGNKFDFNELMLGLQATQAPSQKSTT